MERNFYSAMLRKGVYMALAAFVTFSMTACSSDDSDEGGGNPALVTPAYEASAAKYEIAQSSSPYKSIELTASGNYIICLNSGASYTQPTVSREARPRLLAKTMPMVKAKATRAADSTYIVSSDIIYGTYTKTGENQYNLNGYGTLTVTQEGADSYSLNMTRTTGQSYNLRANKAATQASGSMTDLLCRTWEIAGVRAFEKMNGHTYMDITASSFAEFYEKLDEWAQRNDPDYTEGDYDLSQEELGYTVKQVIFSKSGTYMIVYMNGTIETFSWRWQDQSRGILEYSHDSSFQYGANGRVTIEVKNNQLHITETYDDYEDDDIYEGGLTMILRQATI